MYKTIMDMVDIFNNDLVVIQYKAVINRVIANVIQNRPKLYELSCLLMKHRLLQDTFCDTHEYVANLMWRDDLSGVDE